MTPQIDTMFTTSLYHNKLDFDLKDFCHNIQKFHSQNNRSGVNSWQSENIVETLPENYDGWFPFMPMCFSIGDLGIRSGIFEALKTKYPNIKIGKETDNFGRGWTEPKWGKLYKGRPGRGGRMPKPGKYTIK